MASKLTRELARVDRPTYLTPFADMERWFEEGPFSLMRTMWPEFRTRELETLNPRLDVFEEGNEVVVKADLPGMKKEDVEITLTDNVLTISGERKGEEKTETGTYRMYERNYGSFSRSIELPSDIVAEKTNAHFEDGVLEIRLTRSHEAEEKARKIPITS